MNRTFLHRGSHADLILFFNGWGMDSSFCQSWTCGSCDVLALDHYATLDPLPDLSAYTRIHLVAWSLGVWVAAKQLESLHLPIVDGLAINGTLRILDAQTGIAPEIFQGTIDHWQEETARDRFIRRMTAGQTWPWPFARDMREQKEELIALEQQIRVSACPCNPFTHAWIGRQDRIVPAAAQHRFWTTCPTVTIVEADVPHYPFDGIGSWEEVLAFASA